MARDFTLEIYRRFLTAFLNAGYNLTSYENYCGNTIDQQKVLILRHDVDKLPENSLRTAALQNELGVIGTYYFRVVKESYHEQIIEKIASLGHEIGYHYEDMALCNGNIEKSIEHFKTKLDLFRRFYPVKTICMHGSPLSKWDNRSLWQKYNYRDFGVVAEPYFDIDFNKMLYITDTGRKWNGAKVSIRDKVNSPFKYDFSSTQEIIDTLKEEGLPDRIMQNIHPQRWTDGIALWTKELLLQNLKNQAKRILVSIKRGS